MELKILQFCLFLFFIACCGCFQINNVNLTEDTTASNISEKAKTFYDYQTRVIAYKDLLESKCYLERMQFGNTSNYNQHMSSDNHNYKNLHVSGTKLSKQQIYVLGGSRIVEFCWGFPTYFLHEYYEHFTAHVAEENNELSDISNVRKKRSSQYFFVGRVHGQTQSQYLQYGDNQNSGKAEAEASYGRSKAIVSSSQGMGQAQSQSSTYGCDSCFGQDQGIHISETGQPGYPDSTGIPGGTDIYGRPGVHGGSGTPSGPGIYSGPERPNGQGTPTGPGIPGGQGSYGGPGTTNGQGPHGAPGVYGDPGFPTGPGGPGIYGGPGISTGPQAPGTSTGPGRPGIYGGPGISTGPQTPGTSTGPGGPGIYGVPGIPFGPSRPETPTGPDGSGIYGGPGYPTGPSRPEAPIGPGGPGFPTGPSIPGTPTGPGGSGIYGGPGISTGPQAPGTSTGPGGPEIYGGPSISSGPSRPGSHTGPDGSGIYGGPGYPTGPSRPGTSIEPGGPGFPTGPSRPGTPTGPGGPGIYGPGYPTGPITPSGPAGPTYVGPGIPTGPQAPGTSTGPGIYGGPGIPSGPSRPGTPTGPGGPGIYGPGYPTGPITPTGPAGPTYVGPGIPTGPQVPGTSTGPGTYGGSGRPGIPGVNGVPGVFEGQGGVPQRPGVTYGPDGQIIYPLIPGHNYIIRPDGTIVYPANTENGGINIINQITGPIYGNDGHAQHYPPHGNNHVTTSSWGQNKHSGFSNYPDKSQYPNSPINNLNPNNNFYPASEKHVGNYGTNFESNSQIPTSLGGGSLLYPNNKNENQYQHYGNVPQQNLGTQNTYQHQDRQIQQTGGSLPQNTGHQGKFSGTFSGQFANEPYYTQPLENSFQNQQNVATIPNQNNLNNYQQLANVYNGASKNIYPNKREQFHGTFAGQYNAQNQPENFIRPGSNTGPASIRPINTNGPTKSDQISNPMNQRSLQDINIQQDDKQALTTIGNKSTVDNLNGDDDAFSQVQTSIQLNNNKTQASASAHGTYLGGNSQSEVSGSYSGTGTFSASAGSNDGKRGAQTQVSGNEKGILSSAQGTGGVGKSQAQIEMGSQTGETSGSAQTSGLNHLTNTQVQSGLKGGMADAQANGPGRTSSQAQISFIPENPEENNSPLEIGRGGSVGAQSGTNRGQSQVQLQGKLAHGIKYTGSAQATSNNEAASDHQSQSEYAQFPTLQPLIITTLSPLKNYNQQNYSQIGDNSNANQRDNQFVQQETTTELYSESDYTAEDYDYENENPGSTVESKQMPTVIDQSTKTQKQHIVLDPLENIDAIVTQAHGDPNLPGGKVLQPGEKIPGSPGYQIPQGFRGVVKAVSSGPYISATGYNAQAQSVSLVPGSGQVHYKQSPMYATITHSSSPQKLTYKSGYSYQPMVNQLQAGIIYPGFVSTIKSETKFKNLKPVIPLYYSKSSSCGYFTNKCFYVGKNKICSPKKINKNC